MNRHALWKKRRRRQRLRLWEKGQRIQARKMAEKRFISLGWHLKGRCTYEVPAETITPPT